jgi:hypothetical protein
MIAPSHRLMIGSRKPCALMSAARSASAVSSIIGKMSVSGWKLHSFRFGRVYRWKRSACPRAWLHSMLHLSDTRRAGNAGPAFQPSPKPRPRNVACSSTSAQMTAGSRYGPGRSSPKTFAQTCIPGSRTSFRHFADACLLLVHRQLQLAHDLGQGCCHDKSNGVARSLGSLILVRKTSRLATSGKPPLGGCGVCCGIRGGAEG